MTDITERLRARIAELERKSARSSERLELRNADLDDALKRIAELEAQRVPEGPKGQNQFGLDARYFHEKLSLILRDIMSFTPDELNRALTRLANTAAPAPSAPAEVEGEREAFEKWLLRTYPNATTTRCPDGYIGTVPHRIIQSTYASVQMLWEAWRSRAQPDTATAAKAPAEVEGERNAFEAWATEKGFSIDCRFFEDGNNFESPDTRLAYEIWQAARAQLGAAGKYTRQDLQRWRDDALEAAAQICDRYGLDAYGAGHDIRVMKHKEISDAPYNPNDRAALTATGGRDEYVRGVKAMATEAKQLCRDFSDLRDRPYMGDVTVAIDALAEQVAAAQPAQEAP